MTEVVKKRGRPKGAKDTTKREVTPYERTEAQKAAQFKAGNNANVDGWSLRKETRAYRKFCANLLLSEEGKLALITMYTELANQGRFREFMELHRFMAEYGFGKTREMLETEEEVKVIAEGTENSAPIIGLIPGSFENMDESDAAYL